MHGERRLAETLDLEPGGAQRGGLAEQEPRKILEVATRTVTLNGVTDDDFKPPARK